jgi:putative radical SAM enzyme (TIGR03279 family)
MMAGITVEKVLPGSIAEEMEIESGDLLKSVNGNPIRDIIDFNYFTSDHELSLEVIKQNGEVWEVRIEREEGELLGLIFPPPKPIQCGNRCIFCFVHQLPWGLRPALYVKDEDYRLSFLYGNYVTLANIHRADIDRIKEQRLSPLYISVHSTDPHLRERILGKRGIIPIMDVMGELSAAQIIMHAQVVLCPGINDGAALDRTVEDLVRLHPWVASLAIVPVGLTRHRKGLPQLQPVTEEYAESFVDVWSFKGKELEKRLGEPFLFLADEFYLKGVKPFPPLADYGELPQLENGVGMAPLFMAEAAIVLKKARQLIPFRATVVTGESPFDLISAFLIALGQKTGVDLHPVAIGNRLFGSSVTVAGLVSGKDIAASLSSLDLGEAVLVPDVMLKEGEGLFIDDMNLRDLEKEVGTRLVVFESTPGGLHDALKRISSRLKRLRTR